MNLENLELNNNYSLSIRLSPNGFSLSILDQAGMLLVAREVSATGLFQMRKAEIIELFETKMGVTPSDFNDMQIIVESDLYVFIPDTIFSVQHINDYFHFEHEKDKTQVVLFNRIASYETINIFSIPLELNEVLNKLFPDSAPVHHLSYFLSEKIKTNEDGIHIWVRPKMLDAVVFKSRTLSLINSFSYHTAEDFTYFVLSIFDQLKLDTEKVAVKLYQQNNAGDFKNLISMYVKCCDIVL